MLVIRKAGIPINSTEAWFEAAPPKGKTRHWVDGRSAKELAKAWVGDGVIRVPAEFAQLLSSHPLFASIELLDAEPEARIRFDEYDGEPRNADLAIAARSGNTPVAISAEAKAAETFGNTLANTLVASIEALLVKPRSKAFSRARDLCVSLLPPWRKGLPSLGAIRYQLLTATAGTLVQAASLGARQALLVIHEFQSTLTTERCLDANAENLRDFVRRLSDGTVDQVAAGQIVGPFRVPGRPLFHAPADLYIGKAVRHC